MRLFWLSLISFCLFSKIQIKADSDIFSCINATDGLCDNKVLQMLQLPDGRMAITTAGNVNIYDGYRFSYIHKKDNFYFPLPAYLGYYHLYVDKTGRLWVKDWQKLLCMDVRTMSYTKDIKAFFAHLGVKDKIKDFFVDSNKNIWLVTDRGLLNVERKQYYRLFSGMGRLLDLDVDKDKLYLFYQSGDVVCYDILSHKILYRRQAYSRSEQLLFGKTSLLVKGHDGMFYQLRMGTKSGLFSFNTKSMKWRKLMVKDYPFHTLVVTKQNIAYITCPDGYWSIDLNRNTYRYDNDLLMTDGTHLHTGLNTVCVDRQGGLWMGTYSRGLLYSSPYKSAFTLLPDYKFNCENLINSTMYGGRKYNTVFHDSRGWVWCGTNDGLRVFIGRRQYTYYTEDGMCNNMIHIITEDKHHNIWVGTSYGISRIRVNGNRPRITFTNYQKEQGIQKNDYIDGMVRVSRDGWISMRGLDGWTVFHPDSIRPFNQRLNPILIGKGKNTLSFDFAALNYACPDQTSYRYRLNDGAWHIVSANERGGAVDYKGILHLSFIGLQPGSYNLQVMASMNVDRWDGKMTTVSFIISPPWWRTTIAYCVYALLSVLLLLFAIRMYIIKMRLRMQTRHNEEIQRMQKEMEFISHASAMVEHNIRNQKYSVEQLSCDMCMDRTGLYKKLTSTINKTPTVFIRDIRLDQAAKLIRQGNMSIGEIADEVGFCSSSYMSKCFQDKFGCKPSEYK